MTIRLRNVRAGVLILGLMVPGGSAMAQMGGMSGGGRSLGGYGGPAISSYYVGRGSSYVPYAGGGGGYAPASSPMRPTPAISRSGLQTPIGGASTPGSSSAMGMGASGRSVRQPLPVAGGMGMGSPVGMPMTRTSAEVRGKRGPGLGWPFRMPPALPGRSAMGSGMQ